MPAKYDAIKRDYVLKGFSTAAAETHAAKIYNATRKPGQRPVTRNYDQKKKD